jgi:hypothetical protein
MPLHRDCQCPPPSLSFTRFVRFSFQRGLHITCATLRKIKRYKTHTQTKESRKSKVNTQNASTKALKETARLQNAHQTSLGRSPSTASPRSPFPSFLPDALTSKPLLNPRSSKTLQQSRRACGSMSLFLGIGSPVSSRLRSEGAGQPRRPTRPCESPNDSRTRALLLSRRCNRAPIVVRLSRSRESSGWCPASVRTTAVEMGAESRSVSKLARGCTSGKANI